MRNEWHITEMPAEDRPALATVEVLVEYDGPQIVKAQDASGNIYLGVASDEDSKTGTIRWIYSKASDMEFAALLEGATTVRDVLEKSNAIAVDKGAGDAILKIYRIKEDSLLDDVLPEYGAILPGANTSKQTSSMCQFRLAGLGVSSNRISFFDLAAFVDLTQKLWIHIKHFLSKKNNTQEKLADLQNIARLYAEPATLGSYSLNVFPEDEKSFNEISKKYNELIFVSDNENKLLEMLEKVSYRLRSAYLNYLDGLAKRKIEVLASWKEGATFIAPERAGKIVKSLKKIISEERQKIPMLGRFEGFDSFNASFRFKALDGSKTYSGELSDELYLQLADSPQDVLVGRSHYDATIEIIKITTTKKTSTEYVLLSFALHSQNLAPTE